MPELLQSIHPTGPGHLGVAERGILALVNPERLRRILSKMLDENEFLSPYGIRSISKFHQEHPYVFNAGGQEYRVDYLPAESNTGMFGGNSNWRGPIWMPVNVVLIRGLLQYYLYYGDAVQGRMSDRLGKDDEPLRGEQGDCGPPHPHVPSGRARAGGPCYGGTEKFQNDPHWKDNILFHEYFHGDNGAGLGASHQTGWTGAVAMLIHLFGGLDRRKQLLQGGRNLPSPAAVPATANSKKRNVTT